MYLMKKKLGNTEDYCTRENSNFKVIKIKVFK